MNDRKNHDMATHRFIDLANEMQNEGLDINLVSAALMASSGIYATYVAAGNNGALQQSGIDKVVEIYRNNLEHIQKRKKEELEVQVKP
jgi:hypothetical protein